MCSTHSRSSGGVDKVTVLDHIHHQQMAVRPDVRDFPSYVDTSSSTRSETRCCIWYLPDKQRFCQTQISKSDHGSILKLAGKSNAQKSCEMRILAEIAELSCCARNHRNRMWGCGLARALAHRWRQELRSSLLESSSGCTVAVQTECEHYPCCDADAADEVAKNQLSLVAFAPHVPFEKENMESLLLSRINPKASKEGSVYAFTYSKGGFDKMVKIGSTGRPINLRMAEWGDCGYGQPHVLKVFTEVRHPERVEFLTHFQLAKVWYELRWCETHQRSHIEWFKTTVNAVSEVVQAWATWIERANPYDRRGHLKPFWRGIVDFLFKYEIIITAELMLQIQEVEDGIMSVANFIDDDFLRREDLEVCVTVKQEEK